MLTRLETPQLRKAAFAFSVALSVLTILNFGAFAQTITGEMNAERLVNSRKEPQNWPTYFGAYDGWRYSSLNQINTTNVKSLVPVWAFQTGKVEGGLNATPIVIDGIMYLIASEDRVFALKADTGERLWTYNYKVPRDFASPYGKFNRGVAVAYGLVFFGTMDNHVVALDAKTGKEVWNVEVEDVKKCGCNINGAPIVVRDKVVVGGTGGDSAHRGYINAFNAKTGRLAWRFYTIPGPGEPGHESWGGTEMWKYGGGSTWLTGSYDPEQNLIIWGVGNPSSDFHNDIRPGSNLYTDCIVALDADSGKLKWYYQEIPGDSWDFDSAYESILIDTSRNGKTEKLLVHTNKSGFVWVVDRTSGKFVNAWRYVDTINWVKGIDKDGGLIERNEPQVGKQTFICPNWGGGRSWNHAAYSPRTGWLYNNGIEWCADTISLPQEPREGRGFVAGNIIVKPPPDGPIRAHLDAFDPVSGEKKWTVPFKYPILSSLLATGGDVLFTGDVEGRFLAFDAKTGKQLWSFNTGSGHRGGPITYSMNGRQYVAAPSGLGSIFVGGMPATWPEVAGFPGGSALFVFALPSRAGSRP
ncbi:MAG TPA: PQQ-dependent dehydrogenase, methanol/ethanol family [Blastocatellia bacterium]|nr:PQQ-dependent dehydrogenase, methanol/ethanol family [Blastocatellia bacterium]